MTETFIALLAAHLIGDFPLQPVALIRRKRNPLILAGHVLIMLALAILALGSAPPLLLTILIATHLLMDAVKVWALPDRLWAFALDQLVHLGVIGLLALYWPGVVENGLWTRLPDAGYSLYIAALVMVSGAIVAIQIGAIVIRLSIGSMEAGPLDAGLPNGGFMIGCLERSLILLLVFMDQTAGVGFLIAAKSILRFGDIQKNERRVSEYIIIGTFMSFGWGLLAAAITRAAVEPWLRLGGL